MKMSVALLDERIGLLATTEAQLPDRPPFRSHAWRHSTCLRRRALWDVSDRM